AGVVALMLDADPTLSADEIKQILVDTASRMPGYEEYQVGAGYVNAFAAVDKVFNRAKNYGSYSTPAFNARFNVSGPAPESFRINYSPAALPGPGSVNSRNFTVAEGMNVLDVFAKLDKGLLGSDGNTLGILLTAPNGAKYSSGVTLPILDAPTRQVVVKNPQAGEWLLEVRGVRGLAAVPNFSLPTSGAALPGPVDITLKQQSFALAPVADIQGHPAQSQIESVLKNRIMDTFSDNSFRPDTNVTREDFAGLLFLNTPLRQSLGSTAKFTDVTGPFAAIAEAVTAKGSNLRDYNFTPDGMMSANGSTFNPTGNVSRLDVAVALVRALGLDAEAKAKAGSLVTVNYNGQTLALTDNAEIPSALRGYVQIALDKGILQAFYTLEQGPFDFAPTLKARVKAGDPMTRGFMAFSLDNYSRRFVAGN
ncbi:MAG TPA: S-layer homology domain-containing protein, partial [Pyrinomonadaceae bacterium]|nr:S-layer homology domain-containing protein [Pyrinomonadaceae bacterium]